MLTRRKDRARLTPKDIEPQGIAGGFEFVTFEGAEYFLEADPMVSAEKPPAPGEIHVTEQRERWEFGTRMTYEATRRGTESGGRDGLVRARSRSRDAAACDCDRCGRRRRVRRPCQRCRAVTGAA
jgi:hypothetical protein